MIDAFPVRTPTLPPATHTNCYLLGRHRLTLVDPASPWREEQARLDSHLDALAASGATVERIVLTHHHNDHVGGAARLRERLGIPILAHAATRDLLAGAVPVDATLDEGDRVETDAGGWDVLFTPGHAPGHLCLRDATTREIVAGDMVAGIGTIVLNPPEGDLALYLASLERLRALAPSRLYPAHGAPIEDAEGLLTEYIDHRNARTAQVQAALATSGEVPAPPIALVPHIYPELPRNVWPLAARQVLCHLLWLEGEGLAVRSRVTTEVEARWLPASGTPSGGGDV